MANSVYNTDPNIYYDGDSVNDDTVTRKMYQASSPSYLNYWDLSDNTLRSFGVMAKLVEDSSEWTVNIPSGLKSGEYLIRHELASSQRFILPNLPEEVLNSTSLVSIQINVVDGGSDELPFGTQTGSLYETDGYLANYDVFGLSSSSSSSEGSTTSSSSSSSGATDTSTNTQNQNTAVDFAVAAATTNTTAPTSSSTSAAVSTTTASATTDTATTSTTSTSSSTTSGEKQCKTRSGFERSAPVEKRALKGHGWMKKRLTRAGICMQHSVLPALNQQTYI
ncbi:hypothetical protein K435DRAFT_973037 [Dendrothele bispora CBS 962.96]|uniref:AA9 family lytic polysaccharide monooxygenase n=1 Tax=Dendrothele bispora (strain CBS 962.96) TaxID=1314807 RepID=A0A4S8KV02_DENBC|nr:hypothetical protein K435DRAFT_973037 [Dendrothele bispora CBS 962.96]